jgi:hypothetical protein
MRIWLYSALCLLCSAAAFGQKDTVAQVQWIYGLYADAYLLARMPDAGDSRVQPFLYNFNRDLEPAMNLGLARVGVRHRLFRGNLALQAGTYVNDNYAAEPHWVRPLAEANLGVALSTRHRIWLDVGIMPSHIGFEGAVAIDNATLTRSILAENSPYYLAALKLSWQPDSVWEVAALICNGWQRIRPVPGNTLPGFGTQLICRPRRGMTINWSTFIGTDDPDSTRRVRVFNNFYGLFALGTKWSITAGFDVGLQQQNKGSGHMDVWLSPALIARWAPVWRLAMAARAEYYRDGQGVIIADSPRWGCGIIGASFNIDLWLSRQLLFRTEGRWLGGSATDAPQVFMVVGSVALKIGG